MPLDVYANPAGLKRAEAEAHRVGTLLAIGKFDWSEYAAPEALEIVPVRDWIERLEQQYFSERPRTIKTGGTWEKEYHAVLANLPTDRPLTVDLLLNLIQAIQADSRTRPHLLCGFCTGEGGRIGSRHFSADWPLFAALGFSKRSAE